MAMTSRRSWRACCQTAFTLVEVVASLMLLGTLLVGILTAHRRHAAQIRRAESRLAAVEAADTLLAQWSNEGRWGAATSTGRFDNREDLTWRWSIVPDSQLRRLGAAIGRLEIVAADGTPVEVVEVLTTDLLPR